MMPFSRLSSLVALAVFLAGSTPSLATPVIRSPRIIEADQDTKTSSLLTGQDHTQLFRALGGFYSQPALGIQFPSVVDGVPVATNVQFTTTVPVARLQAPTSTDLPTSSVIHEYNSLEDEMTSSSTPTSTFDFSYLHTPSPIVQQLNNSNYLDQRRFPTQAVVIGAVLAGVILITFIGFLVLSPRVTRACCDDPKKKKKPKPQCSPPPSWMRVPPPTDEEFMNQQRRKVFSFQKIELGKKKKSVGSVDLQIGSKNDPGSEPVDGVISQTPQAQSGEPVIAESASPDISSTASHGQVKPQDNFTDEVSIEEPVFYSLQYKQVRILYDVKEEDEPVEDRTSMHFQSPLFSGNCRFSQLGQAAKEGSMHTRASSLPFLNWWRLSFGKEKDNLALRGHRKIKSESASVIV